MLPEHFIVLAAAALIVGMSKGGLATAGTLAVPMLTYWYEPLAAAALLLPVYLVSDAAGVWVYRREFSAKTIAVLVPSGLLGVAIASLMTGLVPSWSIVLATGLVGLSYCLFAWFGMRATDAPRDPGLGFGLVMGVLTGITSFIAHTGAPPYQTYVLPQRLPKLVYAGTTTITFAIINLSKLPAYLSLGLMDNIYPLSATLLCAVAITGTWAGRRIATILPEAVFRRIIMVLLFLISLQLIGQALVEAV